jgi:hypothetical protein
VIALEGCFDEQGGYLAILEGEGVAKLNRASREIAAELSSDDQLVSVAGDVSDICSWPGVHSSPVNPFSNLSTIVIVRFVVVTCASAVKSERKSANSRVLVAWKNAAITGGSSTFIVFLSMTG